jgi:hypothetical protein
MIAEKASVSFCTGAACGLYTLSMQPHQQSPQMQTLDPTTAAALEAGEMVRVTYASGFMHRLCLEPVKPPPAGNTLKHLLSELARLPADVVAEPSLQAAETLLQITAQRHGKWRVWSDEKLYLQWLLR